MNVDVNIKMCICVICYVKCVLHVYQCLPVNVTGPIVYQKNTSKSAFIRLKILCAPGNVQHSAASQLHQ